MVEIISRGITEAERKHYATCSKCKTSFSFKRDEAKLVEDRRDGNFFQIECPVCSRTCSVGETPWFPTSW